MNGRLMHFEDVMRQTANALQSLVLIDTPPVVTVACIVSLNLQLIHSVLN
jgi:hypothetical protein